jgi:hypothetical protein
VIVGCFFMVCYTESRKVKHRVTRSFFDLDYAERGKQRRCTFVYGLKFMVCCTESREVFTSSVRYRSGHRVARSFFNVDNVVKRYTEALHFCLWFVVCGLWFMVNSL